MLQYCKNKQRRNNMETWFFSKSKPSFTHLDCTYVSAFKTQEHTEYISHFRSTKKKSYSLLSSLPLCSPLNILSEYIFTTTNVLNGSTTVKRTGIQKVLKEVLMTIFLHRIGATICSQKKVNIHN